MRQFTHCFLIALVFPAAIAVPNADAGPITADAFTVVFDNFNGTTSGTVYNGPLTFAPSQPGYGQAANFLNNGTFVQYSLPWTCCSNTSGTVEFWMNPQTPGTIMDGNWLFSPTSPPFGHVLFPEINAAGFVSGYSYQNQTVGLTAPNPVQFGAWTHFAYTFSPSGSGLYLNGVLVNSTGTNLAPWFLSQNWLYLTPWGQSGFSGLIDDLRVSNIVRSAAEIQAAAAPVAAVPEPGTLGLLAVGLAVLAMHRRRRQNR